MDNPHELPAPKGPIDRVEAFARDLAWGYQMRFWGQQFIVTQSFGGESWLSFSRIDGSQTQLDKLLKGKWNSDFPEYVELSTHGYVDTLANHVGGPTVCLSILALSLLEEQKAAKPLRVFISHKQTESSEFASLIEARLEVVVPDIKIFIDKALKGGDVWLERIEQEIRNCDAFICIFGQTTPDSQMVRKEINWALDTSGCRVIPVWHHGYAGDDYPTELNYLQRIEVSKENAEGYATAIQKLFYSLGRT